MKIDFRYYTDKDFDEVERLILNSYEWEFPVMGLARFEFMKGLHGYFLGMHRILERTCGIFLENGTAIACAMNENTADGDAFFLFDSKERAQNLELLDQMIYFAQTFMTSVNDNEIKRFVNLRVPTWNKALLDLISKKGFVKTDRSDECYVRPFSKESLSVILPEGYSIQDGTSTPDFYLANVHMQMFNYPITQRTHSEEAFHQIRKMPHYNPKLDLCILDPMRRPVGMAIVWHDFKMPYCELEPMGVVWWERRKGLASALLNELTNRVRKLDPNCQGMLGGDQLFYKKIGYEQKCEVPFYRFEVDVYPSWDPKSESLRYL